MLDFWTTSELKETTEADKMAFFNSLELDFSTVKLSEPEHASIDGKTYGNAYKLGYIVGKIVPILLLLLLVIGLIRFLRRKKKSSQ